MELGPSSSTTAAPIESSLTLARAPESVQRQSRGPGERATSGSRDTRNVVWPSGIAAFVVMVRLPIAALASPGTMWPNDSARGVDAARSRPRASLQRSFACAVFTLTLRPAAETFSAAPRSSDAVSRRFRSMPRNPTATRSTVPAPTATSTRAAPSQPRIGSLASDRTQPVDERKSEVFLLNEAVHRVDTSRLLLSRASPAADASDPWTRSACRPVVLASKVSLTGRLLAPSGDAAQSGRRPRRESFTGRQVGSTTRTRCK